MRYITTTYNVFRILRYDDMCVFSYYLFVEWRRDRR